MPASERPEHVLRLTGEQIGSIDPPPEGDWFTDWDEYEDFVPERMVEGAVTAALDALAAEVDGLGEPSADEAFDFVNGREAWEAGWLMCRDAVLAEIKEVRNGRE